MEGVGAVGVRLFTDFIRAWAAAFTASEIVTLDSSKNCLVPIFGFWIISTAPYSIALRALEEPVSDLLEQMITGSGFSDIKRFRKVSPSILGISISRIITSGRLISIFRIAIIGSGAVANSSIPGSLFKILPNVSLTRAESSTTIT